MHGVSIPNQSIAFLQLFYLDSLASWELKMSTQKQKLLSPTKNLFLEGLISGPAFDSVTLWHHAMSQSHTFPYFKHIAVSLAINK